MYPAAKRSREEQAAKNNPGCDHIIGWLHQRPGRQRGRWKVGKSYNKKRLPEKEAVSVSKICFAMGTGDFPIVS
jgi:hypothetical protein